MALFKFFKELFTRGKKNKSKKSVRRPIKKKIKRPLKKLKLRQARNLRKKTAKKPTKKTVKKSKKSGRKKKKSNFPSRAKKTTTLKEKEIGIITHYFDKISVGIIKLKSPLAVGEHIHIKGKNTDFTQVISSMQYNHKDITLAKSGIEIGVKVVQPVHENDLVSKI